MRTPDGVYYWSVGDLLHELRNCDHQSACRCQEAADCIAHLLARSDVDVTADMAMVIT